MMRAAPLRAGPSSSSWSTGASAWGSAGQPCFVPRNWTDAIRRRWQPGAVKSPRHCPVKKAGLRGPLPAPGLRHMHSGTHKCRGAMSGSTQAPAARLPCRRPPAAPPLTSFDLVSGWALLMGPLPPLIISSCRSRNDPDPRRGKSCSPCTLVGDPQPVTAWRHARQQCEPQLQTGEGEIVFACDDAMMHDNSWESGCGRSGHAAAANSKSGGLAQVAQVPRRGCV